MDPRQLGGHVLRHVHEIRDLSRTGVRVVTGASALGAAFPLRADDGEIVQGRQGAPVARGVVAIFVATVRRDDHRQCLGGTAMVGVGQQEHDGAQRSVPGPVGEGDALHPRFRLAVRRLDPRRRLDSGRLGRSGRGGRVWRRLPAGPAARADQGGRHRDGEEAAQAKHAAASLHSNAGSPHLPPPPSSDAAETGRSAGHLWAILAGFSSE
jgi:hypothetical protein